MDILKHNGTFRPIAIFLLVQLFLLLLTGCSGGITDPEAEKILREKLGDTSFTIFPAYIRYGDSDDSYDEDAATNLDLFFEDEDLANVTLSEEKVPLQETWHSNQSEMLRESAEAFAGHILANPIATEYGFLAEYIFLAGSGSVGGIHCYILDTSGIVAFVVALNSHHEAFSEADPQTIEDCTSVLIDVLRDTLTSD
jgi:hypothetical protein